MSDTGEFRVRRNFDINVQTVWSWLKASKDRQNPTRSRINELEAKLKAKDKKIIDQEMTIDIFKKATSIFAQKQLEIIYQIIKKESNSGFPVEKMCQTLGVSRSYSR